MGAAPGFTKVHLRGHTGMPRDNAPAKPRGLAAKGARDATQPPTWSAITVKKNATMCFSGYCGHGSGICPHRPVRLASLMFVHHYRQEQSKSLSQHDVFRYNKKDDCQIFPFIYLVKNETSSVSKPPARLCVYQLCSCHRGSHHGFCHSFISSCYGEMPQQKPSKGERFILVHRLSQVVIYHGKEVTALMA